jgi:hypothetical protein
MDRTAAKHSHLPEKAIFRFHSPFCWLTRCLLGLMIVVSPAVQLEPASKAKEW